MDYVAAILIFIGSIIGGIAANVIANELYDRSPKIARWVLNLALTRLPSNTRTRYQEEWFSHLNDCEGKLSQLMHAIGCLWAAWFALRGHATALQDIKRADRFMTLFMLLLLRGSKPTWEKLIRHYGREAAKDMKIPKCDVDVFLSSKVLHIENYLVSYGHLRRLFAIHRRLK